MASLRLSALILLGQLPSITACYGTDSACGKCGRITYQTISNGVTCAPQGYYTCPVGKKCSSSRNGYCATTLDSYNGGYSDGNNLCSPPPAPPRPPDPPALPPAPPSPPPDPPLPPSPPLYNVNSYIIKTSGSCEYHVPSSAECNAAYATL